MSLEDDIKEFKQIFMKDATPQKGTRTKITTETHREHNHFPQGKTGYVPHPCSNPVNIKRAKRGTI